MTLAALHAWLLSRQRELSFSPEIGDATVGGLVTTMCKDSSVDGPGHLSALVEALTYVNHEGTVSPPKLSWLCLRANLYIPITSARCAPQVVLDHGHCIDGTRLTSFSS